MVVIWAVAILFTTFVLLALMILLYKKRPTEHPENSVAEDELCPRCYAPGSISLERSYELIDMGQFGGFATEEGSCFTCRNCGYKFGHRMHLFLPPGPYLRL